MLVKTIVPALIAFSYTLSVTANPQETTVIPFLVADDSLPAAENDGVVSGIIVGTGTNGETTYVISIIDGASSEEPVTATIIGGPSGATAVVAFTDDFDGSLATQTIACGYQDGNADCTAAIAAEVESVPTTAFFSTSGPVGSFTLVVSTSSASTTEGALSTGLAPAEEDTSDARTASVFGLLASSFALILAAAMT